MKMYQRGYELNFAPFGLAKKSRTILCGDLPLSEYEPVVTDEVVTVTFLRGTMIWLDIISSISAGTAPHLLPHHSSIIASNAHTKLEDIMGCKSWVMLQIGRIAQLYEHKTKVLQTALFDYTELDRTAIDISWEIQCGLTGLECLDISQRNSTTIPSTNTDAATLVTRAFTYMAFIYLHLVTHGFQQLDLLDTAVSGAMIMFQTQIPVHLLSALVCPLFIIGSVARQGDEQFFRHTLSSPPLQDPSRQHRQRILPILEEIWSRRQTTPGFTWKEILDLTHSILLI
jgi:C6 transcription factor Pro1